MIQYKKRRKYKYNLHADFQCATGISGAGYDDSRHLGIDASGNLSISKGYAGDGPSGPAFDTKNFMQGSLVHDALYQLMREGVIEAAKRDDADRLLQKICVDDGMSRIRAWWVYYAVKLFGRRSARENVITASR